MLQGSFGLMCSPTAHISGLRRCLSCSWQRVLGCGPSARKEGTDVVRHHLGKVGCSSLHSTGLRQHPAAPRSCLHPVYGAGNGPQKVLSPPCALSAGWGHTLLCSHPLQFELGSSCSMLKLQTEPKKQSKATHLLFPISYHPAGSGAAPL